MSEILLTNRALDYLYEHSPSEYEFNIMLESIKNVRIQPGTATIRYASPKFTATVMGGAEYPDKIVFETLDLEVHTFGDITVLDRSHE